MTLDSETTGRHKLGKELHYIGARNEMMEKEKIIKSSSVILVQNVVKELRNALQRQPALLEDDELSEEELTYGLWVRTACNGRENI